MTTIPFETPTPPDVRYRVDTFVVPEQVRGELEETMRRNMEFIRTLPGFRGHVVLEKRDGPARFNLMTIAAWASAAAIERASAAVRVHHQAIGLDLPALLRRWGVTMERGDFAAEDALPAGGEPWSD